MSAKHHTNTDGFHRRRGVSPLMRAASAVLGCLWLTTPFAHAIDTLSLSRQNQLSAPYPSSYTKEALAKIARKVATPLSASVSTRTPAPALVLVKNSTPVATTKKSVLELAWQEKPDSAIYEQMGRNPTHEPSPALMEAIIGSGHATSAHTKVKIGYGKAIADNSDTVGMKNGTRLEEPSCLYVKTSVNF